MPAPPVHPIGPTLAQKILSGIDAPDLADAIARSDARKLSSIPGVGKKTAERICLELRDKLVVGETPRATTPSAARHGVDDDVVRIFTQLEDDDRPITAVQNLEERLAHAEEGADIEGDNPAVALTIAVILYLAESD